MGSCGVERLLVLASLTCQAGVFLHTGLGRPPCTFSSWALSVPHSGFCREPASS